MNCNVRVSYANVRVADLNFRVSDPNFRIADPNFKVIDLNFRVVNPNFRVSDLNFGVRDPNVRVQNPKMHFFIMKKLVCEKVSLYLAMVLFSINLKERNWKQIIIWWEIRRILYNLLMFIAGILSMIICSVSIPVIYLFIGFGLNIIYTFGWIIEILIIKNTKNESLQLNYPKYFYLSYIALSILFVFLFAFKMLL